jgi:hypothetical protein
MNLQGAQLKYCTAVFRHTYVKTVFVSQCAALRGMALPPERNTWFCLLLLEHFYILMISLAEDIQFGRFFQCSWGILLQFSCFYAFSSCTQSLTNCIVVTEAQKNLKPLSIY